MRKAGDIIAARRHRAERYDQCLKELVWLRTPVVPANYTHGYQAYVCLFAPEEPSGQNLEELHRQRNCFMEGLARAGVSTRPGTHAVHVQNYYARKYGLKPWDFPNAYTADRLTLTLPLFPQMCDEEQDRVIDALKQEFAQCVA
jgi:dTDP-4-amino-4,6-dideoxygalactose transaminase